MSYESLAPTTSNHSHHGGATITSSIINLLNTIVGAGILAMPFAYKANGILLGTIIILLAGLTAGFGLFLQGIGASFVPKGQASFFSLAKITYPSLAVLFDIAIAIKCFGVGVSYLIIVGDLMPQIMQSVNIDIPVLLERDFWVSVSIAIVGPLSFLRKLDSLKYTSIVALISVGYLVLIVLAHFFIGDTASQRGPIKVIAPDGLSSILQSLPIIIFAFTCHQNMFSVLNELASASEHKFRSIITASIGSSGLFYVIVGLTGYLSFGDNVGGNIIAMYKYNIFSTIGRIAIVVLVIFSYPLQCHPCRASLNHVIHWFSELPTKDNLNDIEAGSSEGDEDESTRLVNQVESTDGHGPSLHVPLGTTRFIVLTSIILVLSFWLAVTVDSLELMLAFVGSTGSTSISFILPGIFGYSLIGNDKLASRETIKNAKLLKIASLLLTIWGILVVIVCLGTNIWLLTKTK